MNRIKAWLPKLATHKMLRSVLHSPKMFAIWNMCQHNLLNYRHVTNQKVCLGACRLRSWILTTELCPSVAPVSILLRVVVIDTCFLYLSSDYGASWSVNTNLSDSMVTSLEVR